MDEEDQIMFLLHEEHYSAARICMLQWGRYISILADPDRQESSGLYSYTNLARTNSLGSIVFSASCLEALINYYGKVNEVRYISSFEKSWSTLDKWRVYPQMVSGMPIREHVLGRIKMSFDLRNQVVHPKAKWKDKLKPMPVYHLTHAAFLINTIGHAARELDGKGETHPSEDWISPEIDGESEWSGALLIP
jgi:hypothetical protein